MKPKHRCCKYLIDDLSVGRKLNNLLREEERREIPGKIIRQEERREKEREWETPQRLPSIPGQLNSYGYRVEVGTNKLVQNDSPKILFNKKKLMEHP